MGSGYRLKVPICWLSLTWFLGPAGAKGGNSRILLPDVGEDGKRKRVHLKTV